MNENDHYEEAYERSKRENGPVSETQPTGVMQVTDAGEILIQFPYALEALKLDRRQASFFLAALLRCYTSLEETP